jgi:hypothetical protein
MVSGPAKVSIVISGKWMIFWTKRASFRINRQMVYCRSRLLIWIYLTFDLDRVSESGEMSKAIPRDALLWAILLIDERHLFKRSDIFLLVDSNLKNFYKSWYSSLLLFRKGGFAWFYKYREMLWAFDSDLGIIERAAFSFLANMQRMSGRLCTEKSIVSVDRWLSHWTSQEFQFKWFCAIRWWRLGPQYLSDGFGCPQVDSNSNAMIHALCDFWMPISISTTISRFTASVFPSSRF